MSLRKITARGGVLRYPDDTEVALFGTNYLPMSWQQYMNLTKLDADFRAVIRRDVADMKRCGIQIVRVHFFDSECSDADGKLIDNQHLEIFDMLVDELNKQEVYLFLTPIAWWYSPDELPDAFARKMTIARMMFDDRAIALSAKFVRQLLGHTNRYTGTKLKDEPCLGVCEIMNEPIHITWEFHDKPELFADITNRIHDPHLPRKTIIEDVRLFGSMFETWCAENSVDPSRDSYEEFQYETELDYLTRMHGAFREAGADHPVAASLYQSTGAKPTPEMVERLGMNVEEFDFDRRINQGIIRAVGDSPVEAVTTGGYPDSQNNENETQNMMRGHAGSAELPPEVASKAVMIYEWDICYTHENVTMYPAMARRWRSLRAQVCCQFQYSDSFSGCYNADWRPHWFNYELTAAKSVAFHLASKLFAEWPRGRRFPTPQDGFITENSAASFDNRQALYSRNEVVLHTNRIESWQPLDLPDNPAVVEGRHGSPYAEYSGSGIYRLERLSDDTYRLTLTRNAVPIEGAPAAIFAEGKVGEVRVVTLDTKPETFRLTLSGWDRFSCRDTKGSEVPVDDRRFTVSPGSEYLLKRLADSNF